jgi:two-component system nitrate/nitrite response regulator NarL
MAREVVEARELTAREREILVLTADGWSVPDIALRLRMSTGTVNTHLLSSFGKLGVGNRAAAVAAALERGELE